MCKSPSPLSITDIHTCVSLSSAPSLPLLFPSLFYLVYWILVPFTYTKLLCTSVCIQTPDFVSSMYRVVADLAPFHFSRCS